jgi:hypothetical protein
MHEGMPANQRPLIVAEILAGSASLSRLHPEERPHEKALSQKNHRRRLVPGGLVDDFRGDVFCGRFAWPGERAKSRTCHGRQLRHRPPHDRASGLRGDSVYAGARKQEDIDALNDLENVEAVRLDVTIQDDIDAAVETMRKSGRGRYGLVNNAGVFTGGPLIETDIGELQWLFDVNVYGVYRVTQAVAPLIIDAKGRSVNISSISGVLDWPIGGLYCMSKHAIEAYNDTPALEMARFDVSV